MRRLLIGSLFLLLGATVGDAQVRRFVFFSSSCEAETGRDRGQLCWDADDDALWVCAPSGGATCEAAGDWSAIATSGGAGGGTDDWPYYLVDRPPTSCAVCDEWNGGADDLTWTDALVGGSAITYERDAVCVEPENDYSVGAPRSGGARAIAAPSGDFVATVKLRVPGSKNAVVGAHDFGIAATFGGTVAAPSGEWRLWEVRMITGDTVAIAETRLGDWGGVDTSQDFAGYSFSRRMWGDPVCLQLRWDDTEEELSFWMAEDCEAWRGPFVTYDEAGNDPVAIGLWYLDNESPGTAGLGQNVPLCADWFRVRTDTDGLLGIVGE